MGKGSDIATAFIPGGYLFVQSALLFLSYGMKYEMPWWVTWFPSVIIGGLLGISIGILLLYLMGILAKATYDYYFG